MENSLWRLGNISSTHPFNESEIKNEILLSNVKGFVYCLNRNETK